MLCRTTNSPPTYNATFSVAYATVVPHGHVLARGQWRLRRVLRQRCSITSRFKRNIVVKYGCYPFVLVLCFSSFLFQNWKQMLGAHVFRIWGRRYFLFLQVVMFCLLSELKLLLGVNPQLRRVQKIADETSICDRGSKESFLVRVFQLALTHNKCVLANRCARQFSTVYFRIHLTLVIRFKCRQINFFSFVYVVGSLYVVFFYAELLLHWKS